MKKIISLVLVLFTFLFANAQFKQIAAGPSFDEPTYGRSELVLMKDKSVIFFTITPKDGINVRIYTADHKESVVTAIKPAYKTLKVPALEGAFEINGDLVLLISEIQDKIPVLYRLIINGKTGQLIREEKIAELLKMNMGMGFALVYGNSEMPSFYASKDPESDNYAIALFNSFESDRNKRIEIVLYGRDHTELARAYYASPQEKYKYLQFISMAVMGSEKVSVLVNGYNSGGENREVILATLKKGASTVSFNELKFPKSSEMENGIVRYNPYTQKLVVIAKIQEKLKDVFSLYVAFVDPDEGKAENLFRSELNAEVNQRAAKIFGAKYKYWGTPVDLYINKDGGFSVAYEETGIVWTGGSNFPSYTGGSDSHAYIGGSSSHTYIETHNIAVVTYDKLGKTSSSYLIPKDFVLSNASFADMLTNQYKMFAYINGNDKSYIVINDTRRNIEKLEKNEVPIKILGISDCDAYYFPLTGNDPIPNRKYLFGESDNEKERNFAPLGISDYDKENDIFILLRLNKEGKKKSVSLVWLKPQ